MGAPLNPVPNVLKVITQGFVDNLQFDKWANVLHFSYTGTAPSNATCTAIAAQVEAQWVTHMAPECPSPTTLQKVQVTDLSSTTAGQGVSTTVQTGSRGNDSGPANAAVLISYPESMRYKGGHPRQYLYVGGIADYQGATEWSNLFQAEALSHWQAFLNSIVGYATGGTTVSGFVGVRYRGKYLPNGGPPHYYLTNPIAMPINIAGATAALEMASQKRRIGRVKR